MLRIAVQSKGRLYEDTMNLLSEADIKISAGKRTLLVQSYNFPIEVLSLRDETFHRAWQAVWQTSEWWEKTNS